MYGRENVGGERIRQARFINDMHMSQDGTVDVCARAKHYDEWKEERKRIGDGKIGFANCCRAAALELVDKCE